MEPTLPGARESYLDLGRYYDALRLEKRREELTVLTGRYKAAYRRAYAFLAAAGALNAPEPPLPEAEAAEAAERCLALLPAAPPAPGASRDLFLDAFTCEGPLSLTEQRAGGRQLRLDGGPEAVSRVLLRLAEAAERGGAPVLRCHDPLRPSRLRRLLFPAQQTAFSAGEGGETVLSLPRPAEAAPAEQARLLEAARAALREAKSQHDALEEVYNPCVAFAGVYAEAVRHIHTKLS